MLQFSIRKKQAYGIGEGHRSDTLSVFLSVNIKFTRLEVPLLVPNLTLLEVESSSGS